MARRKTTLYLDVDVLRATKVLAATGGRSESQVVEDALRAYLGDGHLDAARTELRNLMDRLGASNAPDEDEAMSIAVEEVRAVRSRRRSASA